MRDGLNTRNRLLEAAIRVISERGEAGLKVDEIAEMAEITKPSLYHFYGDREGLVVAAQAERFRRSLRYGQEAAIELARACTTREQYEMMVRTSLTQFSDPVGVERRRVRIDVLGSAVSRPELLTEVNRVMSEAAHELAEFVDIGRQRGWVSTNYSAVAMATWWYSTLLGRYMVETNPAFDVAEWDAIMSDQLLHLVFG